MHVEKITLINFKAFKKVVFNCNSNFNIIIGENNIGKSTIFDSLLLWKLAYTKLIQSNKKDFYKKNDRNSMNLNFTQFQTFRLIDANDLFFNPKIHASIELSIKDNENNIYNLEIRLNTPEIKNSYIRFTNGHKEDEFKRFAEYCKGKNINLHNAIQIHLTKPISTVLKEEQFLNKAQIQKKTFLGFSLEVLRNKILATYENRKFDYLEEKLFKILNCEYKIKFKNLNKEDDEFIKITVEKDNKETDILLVGSGILNILEIFSTIYNKKSDDLNNVNLLLLDEPDSHMHSDIQSKLIDELKEEVGTQTFLITHNDRLMNKANEGELFYIDKNTKEREILSSSSIEEYKIIKENLASYLSEIEHNLEKTLIVTEGKTDWKHFKSALSYFQENGEFENLDINFLEYEDDIQMGDSQLVTLLKELSKVPRDNKVIGIFDCDNNIGRKYKEVENQRFSDNVFGIAIPTPSFRDYHEGICVEFLYIDDDLKKIDSYNRRIYLSEEFSIRGRLNENKDIFFEKDIFMVCI